MVTNYHQLKIKHLQPKYRNKKSVISSNNARELELRNIDK